jgi:tetratricopeptide (TPR) repeat protein
VVYGSNVSDEMADVYLQVSAAHADQRAVLMENYKRYELQSEIVGYGKSLELYPENVWSQEALATCYVGIGAADKAIAVLEQRIKTGPAAVYPVVSLGMALLASGDVARAEAQLQQAIAIDGEDPLAWFGLGKALAAQNKTEPAEQAYGRAVELAPGLLEAHVNLADLLMRRGELDQAARICNAAIDDSPDVASVFMKLGEISARRKNFDQSLEFYESARRAAPYTHPPKVLLGVWCMGNGEQERGMKLLREARAESPDYPVTPLLLGQLASRQQQFDAARADFAAAASLAIPQNWPESHRQRFGVLLHSERFRLAEQLQDEALARDALAQWRNYDPQNPKLAKIAEALGVTQGH